MANDRTGFTIADTKDMGSMVKKLCTSLIQNLVNTSFLARVTMVTGNTLTVTPIDLYPSMENIPMPQTPIYNVLVGMPYTAKTQTTMPIQIGDIGLCIVTNRDLDNYKDTGMESLPNTQRRFDVVDCIFIPLSMQKQETIGMDYVFKYLPAPQVESLVLTVSGQNAIDIEAGQGGSAFTLSIADDGSLSYNLANNTIQIELSTDASATFTDSSNNSITIDTSGIEITDANNNNIVVDSNGVAITDANNNNIEMSSSGVTITDANNNNIEMSSSGVTITDANQNSCEMGSSGVTISDSAGNEVAISSSGIDLSTAGGTKISMTSSSVAINNTALTISM